MASAGETPLWTEGYFSAILDEVPPIPTTIFGVTVGSDPEMTPRQAVLSVPYAMVAGNANGDITPTSVSINGTTVINGSGKWVGPTTGLAGGTGPTGPAGATGPSGRGDVLLCLTGAMPALSITPQGTRVHVVARFTLP